MKKLLLSVLASCLALTMALSSCNKNPQTPSESDSGTKPSVTNAPAPDDEEKPTSTTAGGTDEPDEPKPPVNPEIEIGSNLLYNMAYFLDEAVPSNATEEDKKKFLQNISNGFIKIDEEFLVNDEDVYQLFWPSEGVGNMLTIPVEVPKTGTYRVVLRMFCGGDFSTVEVFLGESKLTGKKGIDLYNANGGLYDFDLGLCVLEEGENELVFRVIGRNEISTGFAFAINSMTLKLESFATDPIVRPEDPDDPAEPENDIVINPAFLLDSAKAGNPGKDIFVQNLSKGFERVDEVSKLNENDVYQLFWAGIAVGDTMKLTLNVEKAGKYDLKLFSNHGGDYGLFEVYLGEEKICGDYNLKGEGVSARSMENVTLAAGANEITFKCIGTNTEGDRCVFAINNIVLSAHAQEKQDVVVKAAFLLDTVLADNTGKDIFVQNLSKGFERVNKVSDLNENDVYQLFWGAIAVGDTMKLTLNVAEAGNYDLNFFSNHGGDYGLFEIYVGDVKICSDYNLKGEGVSARLLENIALAAGDNEITFKCVGTNTESDRCVFAITNIVMSPADAEE